VVTTASGTVVVVPTDIAVGTELGSYRLVSLLGEGAMGRVWRAEHVRLGRQVAIKVLNPEQVARPDVVQRFFREARVVNDIDHEHIVEVTDFVEAPGLAYLVMELLEGTTIRELMDLRGRKRPPLARVLAIMVQVCEALEAAHEKGVVHRDLKPDNIFVVKRGGEDFVKVLDFGVAKLRDTEGGLHSTHTGMVIGTPMYMAPEQALGREVDARTDVWAAGVVLYEMLSGSVPFSAPSFIELAVKIRESEPKPLPARTPRRERIPADLGAVVMKCLEKKPADRFRSMAALAEALRSPQRLVRAGLLGRAAPFAAVGALGVGVWAAFASGVPGHVGDALGSGWRSLRGIASRAKEPAEELAARAKAAASAPAPRPAPTPSPPPRAAEPRPATVALTLRSTPPGATVVRLDTGERLGRTPLHVKVARRAAHVWLRMSLEGRGQVKFAVDLRKDNVADIEFKRVKKTVRRRR
jgi:serine/threonine-protein kinase